MTREQLSHLDDWKLEHPRQDLRGQKLLAPDGRLVGTIREMIVNTESEYVDAIVLEDGTEVPADDLRLEDDGVYLQHDIAAPAATPKPAAPRREQKTETTGVRVGEEEVLEVIEEDLQVGKRKVERGGIRVISRITEQPVEEQVRLREETVHVERRPADRAASDADFATEDKTYEVRATAEEAVVSKTARVTEEVRIEKDVDQHTETVRDTVRRTEVEVENEVEQDLKRKRDDKR